MRFLRELHMKTTIDRDKLLATLKENREQHQECYDEAREGYLEKAQKLLLKRMNLLKEGKLAPLDFRIEVPLNHTEEYDTVIGMVEDNLDKSVTLSAGEYRMLVQDSWDWMDALLVSNAGYSSKSQAIAEMKGLL